MTVLSSVIRDELPSVQQGPEQIAKPLGAIARLIEVRRTPFDLSGGRGATEGAEECLPDGGVRFVGLPAPRFRCGPGTELVQPAVLAVEGRQNVPVVLQVNRLEQIRLVR